MGRPKQDAVTGLRSSSLSLYLNTLRRGRNDWHYARLTWSINFYPNKWSFYIQVFGRQLNLDLYWERKKYEM